MLLRPGEVADALNLVGKPLQNANCVHTIAVKAAQQGCCSAQSMLDRNAAHVSGVAFSCSHLSRHPPAALLMQLLPASSAYTQQRLAAVQQELDGLEERQQAIGRRARWRQAALVWGGLGSQVRAGRGVAVS